jgi:2'-5' RNA ligase
MKESADAIRTFVCIEIPESIARRIEALQHALRPMVAQVSWTKPGNIHLTLKFLGDVEQSRIADVAAAVERARGSIGEFEIEVGGAGCFPSARNPRVLWVGLTSLPDKLKQLHAAIEDALERAGFPREAKRFSPHLTIGRIRSQRNAARVADELVRRGFEPEAFRAREVIVMRSDLGPKGSTYTPQARIALGPHN